MLSNKFNHKKSHFQIFLLLVVVFNISNANSASNDLISTSPTEDKLSPTCWKQFSGYETLKVGKQKWQKSKVELFFHLNGHLPLRDLSDFPNLGDYEKCRIFSKTTPLKYCSLQILVHELDDYLKNITHGSSVKLKRFPYIWTASAVIGFCVPQQCTQNDILVLQGPDGFRIIDLNQNINTNQTLDYSVFDVTCDEFNTPKLSSVMWIFLTFTGFVLFVNIVMFAKRISLKNSFLGCFNLKRFWLNLFAKSTESPKFQILDGVNSLSTLWVVYAGIYEINLYFPNVNVLDAFEWIQRLPAVTVLMAPMVMYQFQTISGFMLGYRRPTFGTSLKQRILGVILPMYPMLLIFHTSLTDLVGGPMSFTTTRYIKSTCTSNAWTSYALIQNYYNPEAMCPIHTWYMAMDFHLILLSPVLFFMMRKSFKMAACVVFALTFIFCLMATNIAYDMHLEPTLQSWLNDYLSYIYVPTHMRSPVWLCSLLAGYAYKENLLVHYTKHLGRYFRHGCIASGLLVLFTTLFTLYSPYYDLPRIIKALYIGFHNLLWSLMILWIMLLYLENQAGNIGILHKFLSSHIFTVLGRLSYGLYLIAPIVQLMMTGNRNGAISFSVMSNILDFIHQLFYKLLLSAYWYLFIQSPIVSLSTYYFSHPETTLKK